MVTDADAIVDEPVRQPGPNHGPDPGMYINASSLVGRAWVRYVH